MEKFRKFKNMIGSWKGFGSCLRCGDSWWWKKEHVFEVTESHGIFPLCEECWQKIDSTEKAFWIKKLQDKWQQLHALDEEHQNILKLAIKKVMNKNS
jgi:hypothetical protein